MTKSDVWGVKTVLDLPARPSGKYIDCVGGVLTNKYYQYHYTSTSNYIVVTMKIIYQWVYTFYLNSKYHNNINMYTKKHTHTYRQTSTRLLSTSRDRPERTWRVINDMLSWNNNNIIYKGSFARMCGGRASEPDI